MNYRFFYVIRVSGPHFKTGIADDVGKRLRNYRCSNPTAEVVGTWPCPFDTRQEREAQHRMKSHPSCKWIGGENFTVLDEQAFIAELRRIFGEPVQGVPHVAYPWNHKHDGVVGFAILLVIVLVLYVWGTVGAGEKQTITTPLPVVTPVRPVKPAKLAPKQKHIATTFPYDKRFLEYAPPIEARSCFDCKEGELTNKPDKGTASR